MIIPSFTAIFSLRSDAIRVTSNCECSAHIFIYKFKLGKQCIDLYLSVGFIIVGASGFMHFN